MAFKVTRKEFPIHRPGWLTRFLLSLNPIVYNKEETLEQARQHLIAVKEKISSSPIIARKKRLSLVSNPDCIELISNKNRTMLRFYINKDY